MDDTKKQIFGHLFRAAIHAIGAREGGGARPAAPPPQKGPQAAGGPRSPALAKPFALKRPPSCCAVKVGRGQGGGRVGG